VPENATNPLTRRRACGSSGFSLKRLKMPGFGRVDQKPRKVHAFGMPLAVRSSNLLPPHKVCQIGLKEVRMARSQIEFAPRKSAIKKDAPLPSPEEIRLRAAEIRRSWTPEERRQREVSIPGWSLLPLILGNDRPPGSRAVTRDRTRRGR
jgi:hypothetical protein